MRSRVGRAFRMMLAAMGKSRRMRLSRMAHEYAALGTAYRNTRLAQEEIATFELVKCLIDFELLVLDPAKMQTHHPAKTQPPAKPQPAGKEEKSNEEKQSEKERTKEKEKRKEETEKEETSLCMTKTTTEKTQGGATARGEDQDLEAFCRHMMDYWNVRTAGIFPRAYLVTKPARDGLARMMRHPDGAALCRAAVDLLAANPFYPSCPWRFSIDFRWFCNEEHIERILTNYYERLETHHHGQARPQRPFSQWDRLADDVRRAAAPV